MTRVCVAGAGVIGSLFAAHLARVAEVSALTRREEHARALNEHGLRVSGRADFTAQLDRGDDAGRTARARARDRRVQGRRRRRDRRAARRALARRDADDGAERDRRGRGRRASRRLARCSTSGHVHERHAPRRTRTSSTSSTRRRGSGRRAGRRPPTRSAVAELIVSSGLKAEAFDDLRPAQWSKLIFNATVNTVAALTGLPHDPHFAAARRARATSASSCGADGRGQGRRRGGGRRRSARIRGR